MSAQQLKDAERLIAERSNDPIISAFKVILEHKLEKCKDSLLDGEGDDQRGRGKMCKQLLKILNHKVPVDNKQ
jgi:hypothetical protein